MATSNLPIRDHLAREARRITDAALADLTTPQEFNRRLPKRRRRFMEMMGLSDLPGADARGAVPYSRWIAARTSGSSKPPAVIPTTTDRALLDGRMHSVFLDSPPASQNVASERMARDRRSRC